MPQKSPVVATTQGALTAPYQPPVATTQGVYAPKRWARMPLFLSNPLLPYAHKDTIHQRRID